MSLGECTLGNMKQQHEYTCTSGYIYQQNSFILRVLKDASEECRCQVPRLRQTLGICPAWIPRAPSLDAATTPVVNTTWRALRVPQRWTRFENTELDPTACPAWCFWVLLELLRNGWYNAPNLLFINPSAQCCRFLLCARNCYYCYYCILLWNIKIFAWLSIIQISGG